MSPVIFFLLFALLIGRSLCIYFLELVFERQTLLVSLNWELDILY